MMLSLDSNCPRFFDESAPPAPSLTFGKKTKDFFDRCFSEITSFIYETPLTVVGLLIAGVTSIFFLPQLTTPLFSIACASLATKLATKIVNRYDYSGFAKFERYVWEFHQNHEKWHFVAGLVVLAVGFFIPYVGAGVCAVYGVYTGLVMEMEMCRTLQEAKNAEVEGGVENALSRLAQ